MSDAIHGEPIRLTAAEWEQVGQLPPLGAPIGAATMGTSEGCLFDTASRDRGDPVMTFDDYLLRKQAIREGD
jgi:hypothetical protein